MAALSNADRLICYSRWIARQDKGSIPSSKPEMKSAFNAVDDWLESNTASCKSSIPNPPRADLTNKQIYQFVEEVVRRKGEIL
jgi:hypothetical protein